MLPPNFYIGITLSSTPGNQSGQAFLANPVWQGDQCMFGIHFNLDRVETLEGTVGLRGDLVLR